MAADYDALAEAARPFGLRLRGGFHPAPADGVPPVDGAPARTLILLGNAGPAMWRAFAAAPEAADGGRDPLNRWSRRVIAALAGRFAAAAIFPFEGPPYRPFQRWAQRAEPVAVSPIGILIHPDYGLWHAYRGALAFAARLALPPPDGRPSPCASCAGQPCLHACPVAAFTPGGYDVAACAGHLDTAAGADCLGGGCLARRACPVGREYVYDGEQAGFHMASFHRNASRERT